MPPSFCPGKLTCGRIKFLFVAAGMLLVGSLSATAQDAWKALALKPSTLGLEGGTQTIKTPEFNLRLVKASQTVAALMPLADTAFDFTPVDRLKLRSSNGMYHLGDINLRLRIAGDTAWKSYATASIRKPVTALKLNEPGELAAADLSNTLPAGIPVKITRYWKLADGHLVLLFTIKNTANKAVQIGALGVPMIFNNILQGKTLEETHAGNVFYDPYIGNDAGYLQVARLSGKGPVLVVVPYAKTSFEAYNPLTDATPKGIDFEGFYEWMVHTKAYADNEWKKAEPWNKPTMLTLSPGQTVAYGFKFLLAEDVKAIEGVLTQNKRPVAVGIPGYVLPMDAGARLFLNYDKKIASVQVEPQGALLVKKLNAAAGKSEVYQLTGKKWGRARLTITYSDGLCQTISYKIIKPEADVVRDYGHFLTTAQWFNRPDDPFGRNPSVISYDYEKKQQVTQDSRAWIAGLSDEGGAGSWLGAVMKQVVQPDKAEIEKLQQFVTHTLWGNIQHSSGAQKFGVKKSVFYYQPDEMPAGTYSDSINYKTWAAWNRKGADDVGRSYNYPHVAAAHWAFYRLARYHQGLVTGQQWSWYLNNAYQTTMAMVAQAPYYAQFGQMEGTIFYLILMDLKAEGWHNEAAMLEQAMKARADHWHTLLYPFGSEMPWDSTGQEEVYLWSAYFGYDDKAKTTLDAILAYMPTLPHWGYNGSARRYWDFLYGGKLSRVERQLHHYGSGLNAIPVLSAYRKSPDDIYLLRVGYGGLMGSIANITYDGFGPSAFHAYPSTLQIDGLSGDYGSNFFGYAVNNATYVVFDKDRGWLVFGGNLSQKEQVLTVNITSGSRSRIYIGPLKLWLTLKAGVFSKVIYNTATKAVTFWLDKKDSYTANAYLNIHQPNATQQGYSLKGKFALVNDAYVIPLTNGQLKIDLTKTKAGK